MNFKRNVGLLAVVLAFTFATTAQDAPKLTFKFQTVNVKGASETDIYGIGDSGAAVGSYTDSSGTVHGLKLVGKKATNIDDPNATSGTFCYNINASGAIVGYYLGSSGAAQGFMYKGGKFTDVG